MKKITQFQKILSKILKAIFKSNILERDDKQKLYKLLTISTRLVTNVKCLCKYMFSLEIKILQTLKIHRLFLSKYKHYFQLHMHW